MGVPLKVTGSIKGTTLKKTEPLLYSIPFVNVLESGNKSWGGCLCEDIITSGNNDLAQKTGWFQSQVLVWCYGFHVSKFTRISAGVDYHPCMIPIGCKITSILYL